MNLSNIDLNLLHVLQVVLVEGSVSRAAARLHVTSPAVSNALARLREALGDPLLVRSGRGLVPTPRALALLPLLTSGLGALSQVLDGDAPFDPQATTRTLTLALTDADQTTLLPHIAAAFVARMPRARLRAISVDALHALGGLAGPEVDAVIGPPDATDAGGHFAPLSVEEGVLVVRRDHPRIGRSLSAAQFRAERHIDVHIALGRGGIGHRAAEDVFASLGLSRDIAVVVPTFTAAAWVAATTEFVAGMPRSLALHLGRTLPLKVVRGPLPRLRFPLQLSWHARTHADPAAACFRALVLDVVRHPRRRSRPR